MWRHGDVLIAATPQIPEQARRRAGSVLAHGEITGHSHRFADPAAAELWEHGGQLFVRVTAPSATLIHEEHRALSLPQGVYRVWMQREYTPQAIRAVAD